MCATRRSRAAIAADYVIIGCMTEDLKRGVNVYYPFRYANPEDSPNAAAMPYAALNKAGELVVHPPMHRQPRGIRRPFWRTRCRC